MFLYDCFQALVIIPLQILCMLHFNQVLVGVVGVVQCCGIGSQQVALCKELMHSFCMYPPHCSLTTFLPWKAIVKFEFDSQCYILAYSLASCFNEHKFTIFLFYLTGMCVF